MISDRLIARLGWVVPSITFTLSMLIHHISGNSRNFPFFISESDYPGLERWIFTTGLFVTGLILCYVSFRLWKVHLEKSLNPTGRASHALGLSAQVKLLKQENCKLASIIDYQSKQLKSLTSKGTSSGRATEAAEAPAAAPRREPAASLRPKASVPSRSGYGYNSVS